MTSAGLTTSAGEMAMEVVDLSVVYGGVRAVDGVSLGVAAGSVTGLIGPNGAGKTTLIDAVTGFAPVHRGTVVFGGVDITDTPAHQRVRAGLGRTFQSLELFDDLTVAGNLAVAGSRGIWQRKTRLASSPGSDGPESGGDVHDQVAGVGEMLGIGSIMDQFPPHLSHGQRRMVALGRALVTSPLVVCLDEPAAGLDATETAWLATVIASLPARGITVMLIDHDMDLVMGVCDTIHVLNFGRHVMGGTPAQVQADAAVRAAYLGVGGGEP